MSVRLQRPATTDGLFLWVMHRFAEEFQDRAILKGGMALRLLDCPRFTNDLDYVFVPHRSKKEIRPTVEAVLRELTDADIDMRLHSTSMAATIRLDGVMIQVDATVAEECPSTALPTGGFATGQGQPSRIVRIMAPDSALAHKLAAWNERRLLRDLYDCWFLHSRLGETPDPAVLDDRLARVRSRLPELRQQKTMTRTDLVQALREAGRGLDQATIEQELFGVLPAAEQPGILLRLRAGIAALADRIEDQTA